MKNRCFPILLSLLLVACNSSQENSSDQPESLNPSPKTVDLKTEDSYQLNPWTNDSIFPFATASTDTLQTGISLNVNPTAAVRDSLQPLVEISAPDFESVVGVQVDLNVSSLPAEIPTVEFNPDSLTNIPIGEGDKDAVLTSTNGDTLLSGVGLTLQPKKVPVIIPENKIAGPRDAKDNTIIDLTFLGADQGLPATYLRRAYTDQQGHLWFGTFGGGVFRYDGMHIMSFSEKNGLSNENVYAILQDSKGNFWFGTEGGGLNFYDGNQIHQYTEKEGFCNDNVYDIIEADNGDIWIGTYNGLVQYDSRKFTFYTTKEGMSMNAIRSLDEDTDGNIWIGTEGGGAMKFDGKSFTHLTANDGLAFDVVYDIVCASDGSIWFGTKWGVNQLIDNKLSTMAEEQGIVNSNTYVIEEDGAGDMWFGSIGGGVTRYDGENITSYTEDQGLTNNLVLALTTDPEQNIWIGTYGGGINRLNPRGFYQYADKQGMSLDIALSIYQSDSGQMWFGMYGGGLCLKEGNEIKNITRGDYLRATSILDFYEDDKGNLWFSEYGIGVTKYDGETFTHFDESSGLGYHTIMAIDQDKEGNYWFASEGGGFTIYDGEDFSYITEKEGLNDDFISCMIKDHAGNLWFGTYEAGIGKYDGSQFTYYTPAEGLSHEVVYSIKEDSKGIIWAGTKGGLCKFDGDSFTRFAEDEGMSHNAIRLIEEDHQGNLWIGTPDGLNLMALQEDGSYSIRSFDKTDGLKSMDFFPNAVCIDDQNRMWLGGGQGVEVLDLNTFALGNIAPQPSLNAITINQQYPNYRESSDSLNEGIEYSEAIAFSNFADGLELEHDKNHLTFYFSALDWEAPERIQYVYRIPELNSKWSKPSSESKAEFRNLPHGDFTFELKAIGVSKIWSDTYSYAFKINPPWWRTIWAYIIYCLIGIVVVYGFVRVRIAKLQRRKEELEEEVEIATKEIKQQKEQIEVAHAETVKQKAIIEEHHREITDSIAYAKHLQDAILPALEDVNKYLDDNFILFKPKDVVSGDFYWFEHLDGTTYIAAADCTGHGVPGAMVSVVCSNALNRTVNEFKVKEPSKILDMTRDLVIKTFEKSGTNVKDGMDVALCAISDPDDEDKRVLRFAGAHNPVWIIRNEGEEIEEIKANKQPVGKFEAAKPFEMKSVDLDKGDTFYIFSDGYADQFGGEKGKKFKTANFKRLLVSLQKMSMSDQLSQVEKAFTDWRGDLEQVDDVCVIGVRV